MDREQVYWDSNAFLGFLNDEPDKADACTLVLKAAENGHLMIVTSAIALAEVIYLKGQKKLDPAKRAKIDHFFRASYISVRNVTRETSDLARNAVWDNGVRPMDAIHVATACLHKIPAMNTFDGKLIARSGLVLAGHSLTIEKPKRIHQEDWVDGNQ